MTEYDVLVLRHDQTTFAASLLWEHSRTILVTYFVGNLNKLEHLPEIIRSPQFQLNCSGTTESDSGSKLRLSGGILMKMVSVHITMSMVCSFVTKQYTRKLSK